MWSAPPTRTTLRPLLCRLVPRVPPAREASWLAEAPTALIHNSASVQVVDASHAVIQATRSVRCICGAFCRLALGACLPRRESNDCNNCSLLGRKHTYEHLLAACNSRLAVLRRRFCLHPCRRLVMSASARSIAAHEATPQRRASRPIPISPSSSAEFGGNFTTINDGDVPTVTAASLQARASDAALRDYLMWRRVGSPLVTMDSVHDGKTPPRAEASSRSPSPRTVTLGNLRVADARLSQAPKEGNPKKCAAA